MEFIPYGRHFISESDISAVSEVLRSSALTQGTVVPNFENSLCQTLDSKYAIAVNSATSALHIACVALNLSEGDILWTSPITFVASANCALYCGAKVDFVDIDPLTGLMSIEALSFKLEIAKKSNKLPKVVVPVHLAGSSCDMQRIHSLSIQYGFSVVEDASHAIGGTYDGQSVGNCRYSDICVFSFHPVKIITSGEGGVATTNNPELAKRMQDLRSHGITKDPNRFTHPPVGPWGYEQQSLGFNYRMSDIHAALGMSQLSQLAEKVSKRNHIYNMYCSSLKGLPLRLLAIPPKVFSSLHLAVVTLDVPDRELHYRFFSFLREQSIGVQVHYTPVHLQPYYRQIGFSEGDFPLAEQYAISSLTLPLFPDLTEESFYRVVSSVRAFFQS